MICAHDPCAPVHPHACTMAAAETIVVCALLAGSRLGLDRGPDGAGTEPDRRDRLCRQPAAGRDPARGRAAHRRPEHPGFRPEGIGNTVRDYARWNDSVVNLLLALDPVWADDNIGPYVHTAFGYRVSVVLAGDGRTIYGQLDGKRTTEGCRRGPGPRAAGAAGGARPAGRRARRATGFERPGRHRLGSSWRPRVPSCRRAARRSWCRRARRPCSCSGVASTRPSCRSSAAISASITSPSARQRQRAPGLPT